ncbi:DUF4357 domain-containing protein [Ornithinimicrobium sp. Arc0846-15]|nr:DUF4357 domain-containing protein [Ornithinimicrobium laminariae]
MLQEQAQGFVDTPNTVLRRVLKLDQGQLDSGEPGADPQAGGPRERRGRRFGNRVQFLLHDSPSSAAKHLAGYEVSGWKVWRRASDDKSLAEPMGELRAARGICGRGHGPHRGG